jgi:hypothetical protein
MVPTAHPRCSKNATPSVDSARDAITHALQCPYDMVDCPVFADFITARLAGQPLP